MGGGVGDVGRWISFWQGARDSVGVSALPIEDPRRVIAERGAGTTLGDTFAFPSEVW